MNKKYGYIPDGCAMFLKKSVFNIIDAETFYFKAKSYANRLYFESKFY